MSMAVGLKSDQNEKKNTTFTLKTFRITLKYQIIVQDGINIQGGTFPKY